MNGKNKPNPATWVPDYIRNLVPYVPGKPLEELERELGVKNSIKIASNENPIGPSPKALLAIKKALPNLHRYPDGNGTYLKDKLARKLGVSPDNLVLGNGSNEVLELLAATFLKPGDEAVMSAHAFVVYSLAVNSRGYKKIVAKPTAQFGHDLEQMAAAITGRTRIIFIANPNNPTGTYVHKAQLLKFLDRVPERVIVAMDEAYFEFVDKQDYPDSVELFKQGRENIVAVRTFSKIYGLAGLRIGYGVAAPEMVGFMNRVRQPFNTGSLSQVAALAALEDKQHVLRTRKNNAAGMNYLEKEFSRLGVEFIPSVTNFMLFRAPFDAKKFYHSMLLEGVILRPMGGSYGIPDWLRVTIGTPAENKRFIKTLEEVAKEFVG
jgi:histidinol-phosphate aminotransferase